MNIKHKTIDRVTITGPMAESGLAFDYCVRNGYHITRSGPLKLSISKVDPTRFKLVAEKVVDLSVAKSYLNKFFEDK